MDKNRVVKWILHNLFDYPDSDNEKVVGVFEQMSDNELIEFMRVERLYDLNLLRKKDLEKISAILERHKCLDIIGIDDEEVDDGFSQLN